jgi:hypothetical protein
MKPMQIQYNNAPVTIDRIDKHTFCVHLPEKDVRVQYKADNEGADHWLDLDTNHETEQTKQLGEQLGPLLNSD